MAAWLLVLLHPEVAKALTGYYGVEKAEDRLMVLHFAAPPSTRPWTPSPITA